MDQIPLMIWNIIRAKTKTLRRKHRKLHGIESGNDFIYMTPKALSTKQKKRQIGFYEN